MSVKSLAIFFLLVFISRYRRTTTRERLCLQTAVFQNGVSRVRANQSEAVEAPTPLWAGANTTLHSQDQTLRFFFLGWFTVAFMSLQLYLVVHQTTRHPNWWDFLAGNPPDVSYVHIFRMLVYLRKAGSYDVVVEGKPTYEHIFISTILKGHSL